MTGWNLPPGCNVSDLPGNRPEDDEPDREELLIAWFKKTFAARTPPKSVLDAHPDYRVNWTEIYARMKELGYTDPVVLLRVEWAKLWEKHKLRRWANRLIKQTGSDVLVSLESKCSKDTRDKYV